MKAIFKPLRLFNLLWISVLLLATLRGSGVDPTGRLEGIRAFSRAYEFDSLSWTVSALAEKLTQASLRVEDYLSPEDGKDLVRHYLDLKNQANALEGQLVTLVSDPDQSGRQQREAALRDELEQVNSRRDDLAPYMEQVLQSQLDNALAGLDMSLGGQLIPPVLLRSEPNSYALIVSPRDEIRQEANIMLVRGLSLDQISELESGIEESLDVSALVVGIGGVGLYPSMIIESGSLSWLIHVTAHEWTHNYLTLRPLGMAYNSSPELTTINETIADLSADAVQTAAFQLYYPEYLPPEPPIVVEDAAPAEETETPPEPEEEEPPSFDFREEMHITRLEVDRLLAAGRIADAEAYMEARRVFFWDHGYQIRRLNQAYFAFHGSYAAEPGGAAGQQGIDLGAELRSLQSRLPSYRAFMRQVAWRWRLDQFQKLFDQAKSSDQQ